MTAGCVADTDVAVSVFIIFQRLFCKSLQVVSKVLVLVALVGLVLFLVAPVIVIITGYYLHLGLVYRLDALLDAQPSSNRVKALKANLQLW